MRHILDGHFIHSALFTIYFIPFGIVFGTSSQIADLHPPGRFLHRCIQNGFRAQSQIIKTRQISPLSLITHRFKTLLCFHTQNQDTMCRQLPVQCPLNCLKVFLLHQITHLHFTSHFQNTHGNREITNTVRRVIQSHRTHFAAFLFYILYQHIALILMLHHIGL